MRKTWVKKLEDSEELTSEDLHEMIETIATPNAKAALKGHRLTELTDPEYDKLALLHKASPTLH